MKPARNLLVVIATLSGFLVSGRCEPLEFSGYIKSDVGTKILITDLGDGARSGWLNVGGAFRGFTVTEFDPQHRSVSVKKGQDTIQLPLKESKTGDVSASLLEGKTISVSDNGDFFIGDFAVDPGTLVEAVRHYAHAQSKGSVELNVQASNPNSAAPTETKLAKIKQVGETLRALARDLGIEGWFLQIRLPQN